MENPSQTKYLGMAMHFVYYYHNRLFLDQTFTDNDWNELLDKSDIVYLTNMKNALEYALTTEDYCLNSVKSPHLNRYPIEDIRLFFEKFHAFLSAHLDV